MCTGEDSQTTMNRNTVQAPIFFYSAFLVVIASLKTANWLKIFDAEERGRMKLPANCSIIGTDRSDLAGFAVVNFRPSLCRVSILPQLGLS